MVGLFLGFGRTFILLYTVVAPIYIYICSVFPISLPAFVVV
jgi:hypothetical protein